MMTRAFKTSRFAMLVILLGIAGCNNDSAKDRKSDMNQTSTATAPNAGADRSAGPDGGPGSPGDFGGPNGPRPGPGRRPIDWTAKVAAVDKSKLPPAAATKDVAYEKDIRPLFESACFRCHGGDRARGGLHLDTLEGVLKGGDNGKILVAGKSDESPLVIAIAQIDAEVAMPPTRGPGGPRGPGGGGPEGRGGPNGPGGPGGPPGGFGSPAKPLTPEQVGLVRAWIDQGTK